MNGPKMIFLIFLLPTFGRGLKNFNLEGVADPLGGPADPLALS